MEGQMTNGNKILNAAKIIIKTGEQIESLIEILKTAIDALTDEKQKIRAEECRTDDGCKKRRRLDNQKLFLG